MIIFLVEIDRKTITEFILDFVIVFIGLYFLSSTYPSFTFCIGGS